MVNELEIEYGYIFDEDVGRGFWPPFSKFLFIIEWERVFGLICRKTVN